MQPLDTRPASRPDVSSRVRYGHPADPFRQVLRKPTSVQKILTVTRRAWGLCFSVATL